MANLNSMCSTCAKLGSGCKGTTCQTWTGCVYYKGNKDKALSSTTSPVLSARAKIQMASASTSSSIFAAFPALTP